MASETAKQKGVNLNVGVIEHPDDAPTDVPDGEDTETLDLAARLIAHLAYRIPFLKRFEKRLEGEDKSAGMFSDLVALIVQIFRRNQDQIYELAEQAGKQWVEAKAAKAAAKETASASAGAQKGAE